MMRNPPKSNRRWLDAVGRGILTGVVLSVIFLAGFMLRDRLPATAQSENRTDAHPLLAEVKNLVGANYLRELPTDQQQEYGIIRGYLAALNDPYTFFIDPPVAQSESEVLAGQYGGIGVQIKRNSQGLFVLYPFRDSPAAAAGVQDEDVLVAVNGSALRGDERPDVVDQMLRGEVGGGRGVTITVQHPDLAEMQDYFIEFAVVVVPSVVWRTLIEEPTFGYIQILRFTARTPEELHTALTELNDQQVMAYVLDLRGNAGGLLQESVDVASEFLDGGTVFYERSRDSEKEAQVTRQGIGLEKPLVILVNKDTASAAELVAGAIRDRGRGILIGQKTYGKGSVQLIFRLSDESSIHITTAEWFTPAHTPIDGLGLDPDISMIPAEDGRDVELEEAVRYLREQVKSMAL